MRQKKHKAASGYLKGFFLALVLWYLLALLISAPIVPFPHQTALHLFQELQQPNAYRHMLYSAGRILAGLSLALFSGISAGMSAGRSRTMDQYISPLLYLLYPLPKIAFLPVFMVLLGIGDLSKIVLIAVIVFFPIAVSVRDSTREIFREYDQLIRAFDLSPKKIFKDILLPGILPGLFASLRISLGISLSVLFISENYAADWGLGYSIMNHWLMADYQGMYVGIVLLSLMGLGFYVLTDLIEKWAVPWKSLP